MSRAYSTLLGKAVRSLARLRGGGSALPGLFVEHIDPNFVRDTLADLPMGVVLISGTNGKTTTTKMVVELLESQGLKVFTNRTGSNFIRGVAAALLADVDMKGRLVADIAVLELDEAHAVKFVEHIKPRYSLFLNVMRDQLDRFGEIDKTAQLLGSVVEATSGTIVLNREDSRIAHLAAQKQSDASVTYFGLDAALRPLFPSDDDLRSNTGSHTKPSVDAAVTLVSLDDTSATFTIDGTLHKTSLKLKGVYNVYNGCAALALVHAILGKKAGSLMLIDALSQVEPAFGRGEQLMVGGQPLELVLVKNPGGFRLGLESFKPDAYATMIAVNDNYADGRDMSWLWDVEFGSLKKTGVAEVSGIRGYDMALRLQYDDIEVSHVDTDLAASLQHFITMNADRPKRIFCTYTAMLALRRELAKITNVERVL